MTFRIIFMGSQDFSIPPFEKLLSLSHDILAVVTRPDRPAGRGRKLTPTPVKVRALSQGLPVLEPHHIRDPGLSDELRALGPDFIVVAAYGGILPPELLRIPRRACLGVHPSLLPRYRGANPIRWALIQGDTTSGVSIFQMEEGIDTGNIIVREEVPIHPQDNAATLGERLAHAGADALAHALDLYAAGKAVPIGQNGEASEAPFISRSQERINWSLPAEKILNWIRGLSPHPATYTFFNGKRLKILAARALPGSGDIAPGTIVSLSPEEQGIRVACGAGFLELIQVQLEGGKPLMIEEFLRGHAVEPGGKMGKDVAN